MLRLTAFVGLVGVACVLLLAGTNLPGEENKDAKETKEPPAPLKGHLPPNWKKLGLSKSQTDRIYAIQAEYDAKLAPLESKLRHLRSEEKGELYKVLTEDQKMELRKILEGPGAISPPAKKDTAPPKEKKEEPVKN